MRAAYKEDIETTMAELVYGETIRLPGDFFERTNSQQQQSPSEFIQDLRNHFDAIRPFPTSNHASLTFFVPKQLMHCSPVFVRHDAVRSPLQKPYDGPYRVIS